MRLALVEWEDSSSITGWHVLSDYDSSCKCVSVGLLCREDKKSITLTASKSDSGNYDTTISIPRTCVKKIRYLKVK